MVMVVDRETMNTCKCHPKFWARLGRSISFRRYTKDFASSSSRAAVARWASRVSRNRVSDTRGGAPCPHDV